MYVHRVARRTSQCRKMVQKLTYSAITVMLTFRDRQGSAYLENDENPVLERASAVVELQEHETR